MLFQRKRVVKAIAIKKVQPQVVLNGLQEMGILHCDACGEEFVIGHPAEEANENTAEKQAYWLEGVLAEEHELEKKHADEIELPDDAFLHWRHGEQERKPV